MRVVGYFVNSLLSPLHREEFLSQYSNFLYEERLILVHFCAIVGSIALEHYFALIANGYSGWKLFWHFIFVINMITISLLTGIALDRSILVVFADSTVPLEKFYADSVACMYPLVFYVVAATPYVGRFFALVLWSATYINVFDFVQTQTQLPLIQVIGLTLPGFLTVIVLVSIIFANDWHRAYLRISRSIDQGKEG